LLASVELKMIKVSHKFLVRLKLNTLPAYHIAQLADLHPATLSKLVSGAEPIRPDDDRVIRLASVLGLSKEEAFEEVQEDST
jgi:hypothetical protein